jgi:hypothetical protein
MKNKLRFIAFLGAIVAAVAWAEMPDGQSVTAGEQFSRTKISHLVCPVHETEYWRNGQRGTPLPCWVVDAYEAKLVNAGHCYRQVFGGIWQQCQVPIPVYDNERMKWKGLPGRPGEVCFGPECPPAPGYSLPPWGNENLPCADHDSNDPKFALGCAVIATMATKVREGK